MIVRGAVLVAVWVALQGELSVGNVAGGLAVVAMVALLFPGRRDRRVRIRPVAAVALGVFLLRSLVVSSAQVAIAVLRPTPGRTRAQVVDVTLETTSPLVAAIVANGITLTPGTLTVEIDREPMRLDVHVLGDVDADEVRAQVLDLERRVRAAIDEVAAPVSGVVR